MRTEPIRLTRDELYEKVWSEPMWTLAKTLGLSDVGLAKMCRRLNVPVPWRGYWQRKNAGHRDRRTALPKLRASAGVNEREVVIRPHRGADTTGEPLSPEEQFEHEPENRITVAEILENPHPLVAQTVRELRRTKPDEQGMLSPNVPNTLSVCVSLSVADRAMRILDAFVKGAGQRGFSVSVNKQRHPSRVDKHLYRSAVMVLEETIPFVIEEATNRVERPANKRSPYSLHEYDWLPTGSLVFRIDGLFLDGLRSRWADGKKQRLEDSLNGIVLGLRRAAEVIKAQRIEREENERNGGRRKRVELRSQSGGNENGGVSPCLTRS